MLLIFCYEIESCVFNKFLFFGVALTVHPALTKLHIIIWHLFKRKQIRVNQKSNIMAQRTKMYGQMHVSHNDVKLLQNYCKLSQLRRAFGCNIFVFKDETKVKRNDHKQYLNLLLYANSTVAPAVPLSIKINSFFPIVLFEGSNQNQINKTRHSVCKALKKVKNGLSNAGSTSYPSTKDKAGLTKNRQARRKRDQKLNKWSKSK